MKRVVVIGAMVLSASVVAVLALRSASGPRDPRSRLPLDEPGEYHTAILPDGKPPWLAHAPGRIYPFLICFDGTRIEAKPTGKIITAPGESALPVPDFALSDYPVYWIGDGKTGKVYRCSDGVQLWKH